MTIRDDMLAKIQVWLICIIDQCLLQRFPVKYVNTHGCKVTARVGRLLLKIHDPLVLIGDHDTEALGFFHRNRHNGDRTL